MRYVTGDLFQMIPRTRKVVVPHVVNDIGKFGAGFAKEVARHFPQVKEVYLKGKNSLKLGGAVVVDIDQNLTVFNMIAQRGVRGRNNPHPLSYDALENCMKMLHETFPSEFEVHAPMFGCGLAGGDEKIVAGMIAEHWETREVVIYTLPQPGTIGVA